MSISVEKLAKPTASRCHYNVVQREICELAHMSRSILSFSRRIQTGIGRRFSTLLRDRESRNAREGSRERASIFGLQPQSRGIDRSCRDARDNITQKLLYSEQSIRSSAIATMFEFSKSVRLSLHYVAQSGINIDFSSFLGRFFNRVFLFSFFVHEVRVDICFMLKRPRSSSYLI